MINLDWRKHHENNFEQYLSMGGICKIHQKIFRNVLLNLHFIPQPIKKKLHNRV